MKTCTLCTSTALVRGSDLCLQCYSAKLDQEKASKPKRVLKHEEYDMQANFFNTVAILFPKLDKLLYHPCNEGKRNPRLSKKIGIKSGVADVHLAIGNHQYNSMYIEFKAGKNTQTDEQMLFQKQAEAAGNKYIVCYSDAEAVEALKEYLKTSSYK